MGTVQSGGKVCGVLKYAPSDFVVEEVDGSGKVLSVDGKYSYVEGCGDFLHVVMKKKNVDTISAVFSICSKLGVRDARVNYAGVKDRVAVTVQRISFYKMPAQRISGLRIKDVQLYPVGRGGKVYLGDLWGNRFTVCVRNVGLSCDELRGYVRGVVGRMRGFFPNFFGEQRFGGVRPVTCPVGRAILGGDVSCAVREYVCRVFEGEDEGISDVRRIAVMGLRRMFVNAVQSYVFNEVLRLMVKDGVCAEGLRIPIVGYLYGKRIIEGVADKYVDRVLRKEKIKPEMFRLRDFPELSSEGGHRIAFEKFYDFEVVSVEKDEMFLGKSKVVLRFSLPKGCYATVFLSEFFDFV